MRHVELLCSLIMLLANQGVRAMSYPLSPEGSHLVGSLLTIAVPPGNTKPLGAFAAQYGQGLSNMLEANPGVDVFLLKSGSALVIPQQLILPGAVRKGIVTDVAEVRLYYYPAGSNMVKVLPIGIGQAGRETPRNRMTAIERKQETPSWTPAPNTRREYAAWDESLPAFVPAGPENPMGLHTIYTGRLYAVHDTNTNFGIGLQVSQGYIRLRDDDIKYLFDMMPMGTRVQLTDRPVKYSEKPDGSRWVGVHGPLSRNRSKYESDRGVPLSITPALRTFISENDVDVSRGSQVLEKRSGMPVGISLVQKHY